METASRFRQRICRSPLWLGLLLVLPWVREAAAQSATRQEFLWVIEKPNAKVFILGSVHALREQDYPLPRILTEAFELSERVVFEVDPGEFGNPQFLRLLLEKASYALGDRLQNHVASSTYRLLQNYRDATGLALADNFRPWYLSALILSHEAGRAGFKDTLGVDPHFYDKALRANKQVRGLEEARFQIELLAGRTPAQQEMELLGTLRGRDSLGQEVAGLVDLWRAGNLAAFAETIRRSKQEDPQFHDQFFTRRNLNWAPQVESLLHENRVTLVIVGAGHLVGEDGLINLLRNRGHVVEQLPRIPARALAPAVGSDGAVELQFEVVFGHNYAIEVSPDMASWSVLHRFVSSTATERYVDRPPANLGQRYYRLKNLDAATAPVDLGGIGP